MCLLCLKFLGNFLVSSALHIFTSSSSLTFSCIAVKLGYLLSVTVAFSTNFCSVMVNQRVAVWTDSAGDMSVHSVPKLSTSVLTSVTSFSQVTIVESSARLIVRNNTKVSPGKGALHNVSTIKSLIDCHFTLLVLSKSWPSAIAGSLSTISFCSRSM